MSGSPPMQIPSPFEKWHADTYPAIDPSRPELSLKGKSAIVSGGGGTIGLATVSALAKAGASPIAIVGRTQKTLDVAKSKLGAQYLSIKFLAVTADVTSLSSLESAFGQIRQSTDKPIDIMIHNAGFLSQPGTLTASDPKEWWTSFEINILGAFNSVRAFLPVARSNAIVVNLSTAAAHVPTAFVGNLSAYSASKVAALRVFEFAQAENPDIHFVNVQPGVIASDMNTKHAEMPPMDTPELPASFIVWACSPEAAFLKGKLVWANWDVEEIIAKAAEIQNSLAFTMGLTGWPSLS